MKGRERENDSHLKSDIGSHALRISICVFLLVNNLPVLNAQNSIRK